MRGTGQPVMMEEVVISCRSASREEAGTASANRNSQDTIQQQEAPCYDSETMRVWLAENLKERDGHELIFESIYRDTHVNIILVCI